jgi:RNA polymerase sigma factor (sigma-70 family)
LRPTPPLPLPSAFDLDMTRLEDEPLVVLAQECGYEPARHELIRRYLPWKEAILNGHMTGAGFQEADRQDVQQDAVLWVVQAIAQYRTDEYVRPGGCHFRSFLYRVLISRLIDSLRHRRRVRRHFRLAKGVLNNLSHDSDRRRGAAGPGGGVDPLQAAEAGELRDRLHRALGRFGAIDRRVWDLLTQGIALCKIASVLNSSYDAVKRRRRLLVARLSSLLAPQGAGASGL